MREPTAASAPNEPRQGRGADPPDLYLLPPPAFPAPATTAVTGVVKPWSDLPLRLGVGEARSNGTTFRRLNLQLRGTKTRDDAREGETLELV